MNPESSRTKKWIAAGLGMVALFMVTRMLLSGGGGGPRPGATYNVSIKAKKAASGEESLDPRLRLDLLANSESVMYEGSGKNIFRAAPEVVAIPKVKVPPLLPTRQPDTPTQPPPPPPPPPINLKFFGYSSGKGEKPKAFLSQGDNIWIAHEGDVVNRQYKIVRITPTSVEVEDLLNNNRQSIRLTQG
jgi:hypothetical protein